MVEPQPSKLVVRVRFPSPASGEMMRWWDVSIRLVGVLPVIRAVSKSLWRPAAVAQLVERVLGKDEVMGSSPISSSSL